MQRPFPTQSLGRTKLAVLVSHCEEELDVFKKMVGGTVIFVPPSRLDVRTSRGSGIMAA
jgi:hypothetical protein